MALYKNELIEKANKNFRYAAMYIIVSACLVFYYLGVYLWIVSHNEWKLDDQFVIDFYTNDTAGHDNHLANILMIIFFVMSILALVVFALHFVLMFINSIRIITAGEIATSRTKVWASLTLAFLLATLAVQIMSTMGYLVKDSFLSIFINWFGLICPLILLVTTGCCKLSVNTKN